MDPFSYINSLSLFGNKSGYNPGLDRIKNLVDQLGNPQQKLNVIHLAGTNGKGSTAAILERIYREAGYKTALYSSPHYYHFNERIKINGQACPTIELAEILAELKSAAASLKSRNHLEPSFFEIVTAAAFKFFQRHEAEIVILETGLGGRLDATNIIEKPLLSIITNITLEHQNILGDNAAQIAFEKAGIIKENSKVITGVDQEDALKVIKDKAAKVKAKFIDINEEYDLIKSDCNLRKNLICLKRTEKKEESYQLSLLGEHQALNSALALRAVEELNSDFPVRKSEIRQALKNIYWPGRMEKISEKPLVILDAAHNQAAFRELVKNINNSSTEFKQLHLIFSILKDKDLDSVLAELSQLKLKTVVYLAENHSFRTIKIDDLSSKFKGYDFKFKSFNNLAEASSLALQNAASNDLIVAAGSFNTIFEAGIEIMTKVRGENNE
ncbi:dihydrofolate synthase/folylpolyglutamate synthase [Halanaerobium congolense]|uniref:tetrahydrofolate synthase n=1 Tax=Halanaerobium congolense TaxID=54121 RepID=A0A4R8G957_9FIRM|nr:folylpolyglutamate synthase/dihydrofolate synthase family protein [Halanaerobium congolense]TDX41846.1 dihydrofolate synthase/folylpolyglutamate synthase [Halanaerobium congolense]